MKLFKIVAASFLLAPAAFAESHEAAAPTGDAVAGAEIFTRNCAACHVVEDANGEVLAGRNAHTGPNLYGVAMRQAGTYPDFNYGDSLVAAGESGVAWTEEHFVGYVQNPTDWLRTTLDDKKARGKMAFQLRSEDDAKNVYAFLASMGPDAAATN